MKDYYLFYFIVNGITEDIVQLRFLGEAGVNKWLHFQNTRTKENHLVCPKQFPLHSIKGREQTLTFKYEEDNGKTLQLPGGQANRPKAKRQEMFSNSSTFRQMYKGKKW